jgi:hypothetical protein
MHNRTPPSDYSYLILGALVALLLVACHPLTQQELRAADAQRAYDKAYDHCLYRVTGPFSGASIEVMHECDRQARIAARAL